MHFTKIIATLGLTWLCVSSVAQVPAKKFKWSHLGPFEMPTSNVDTGRWTAVGQGWIEDLLITDKLWYAGSITGGLYCSKNEGKNWEKIDEDSVQMGTHCLLRIRDTIYRGLGVTHYDEKFGFGLIRSVDYGKTWESTGLSFKATDEQVVWDVEGVDSSGFLIASTDKEVFVSYDHSRTWKSVLKKDNAGFRKIWIDRNAPDRIWVMGKYVYHSSDGGYTWEDRTLDFKKNLRKSEFNKITRIDIAQDFNNSKRFLAFYGLKNAGFLLESSDGGDTWKEILIDRKIKRADIHHTEIAIAPDNSDVIVVGAVRTFISTDGGKSFSQVTYPKHLDRQFAHDDIRGLYVFGENDIFLATDGGVFYSKDRGINWQNKSGKGLSTMMIYGFVELSDGRFLMGTQDMGYFLLDGKDWVHLGKYYGDGGDALELAKGEVIMMGGRLRHIDIEGLEKSNSVHPSPKNPFIAELLNYPFSLDSFYYVGNELWFNNGEQWINKSKGLVESDHMILGFDINMTNPNQLFIAYDQPTWSSQNLKGKLFKSLDGGKAWQDITMNLPILAWRHITSISTSEANPDEVIVSMGKTDETKIHKVYKSLDGGKTWKNYSEGLPSYETFKIKHINRGSSGIIVSTLKGLYYRNNGLDEWIPLNGDIDPIVVRDFEIDSVKALLNVATYGRGFWQMKIPKRMLEY